MANVMYEDTESEHRSWHVWRFGLVRWILQRVV